MSEKRFNEADSLNLGFKKMKKKKVCKKKKNLNQFDFVHDTSMPPSLVKCFIHHAGLVRRSQESLHLSCSPSISLPAHVSLSQAAKS